MRIRVIPATILTALMLLAIKLADASRGMESLSDQFFISKVEAQQTNEAAPKPETPAEAAAPAPKAEEAPLDAASMMDKKSAAAAAATPAPPKAEEKKEEGGHGEAKKEEGHGEAKKEEPKKEEPKKADAGHGDAKKEESGHGGEKKEKNPRVSDSPGDTVDHRFTAVEVELLQNLAQRREELNRWEQNIQIKEDALNGTEKRIDDKIGQIDAMKKEVAALLAQYNEKEDARVRSLVKIYESMKPGDAARIFNEIEMPILLMVIDKMAEKKAAPILAQMDSRKAKQVTVELAEQRRVNSKRLNKASSAAKPAAAPAAAPAAPSASPAPTSSSAPQKQ